MWIRVTEWPTVTPSAVARSSGRKNCSFICQTWPFSIATFIIPHVRVRKCHIEFFDVPQWGICWHMLDQNTRVPRPLGRPPDIESHVARLEVCAGKHWPIPSDTQLRCRACKARGVTQKVFVKCRKCEVGLRIKKNMVLKITTQRHSSNNIRFDLLNKTWWLKPICK